MAAIFVEALRGVDETDDTVLHKIAIDINRFGIEAAMRLAGLRRMEFRQRCDVRDDGGDRLGAHEISW